MSALIEVTDWWCPSDQRWCMCPGPCPDGTPHAKTRTKLMPYVTPPPRITTRTKDES